MIVIGIFFLCLLILIFTKYLTNCNSEDFKVLELNNYQNQNHNHKINPKNIKKNKSLNDINEADKILMKCFSGKRIYEFNKKYGKHKKIIVFKDPDDNKVKGVVNITPTKYIQNIPQLSPNGYFINNLCVDSEYRNKGIGSKLIKHIISKAKSEGVLHLMLQVSKNSKTKLEYELLIKFYLDLGFKQHEKYDNFELLIQKL